LTKNTKYDRKPTYFWLPVVIVEWEVGKWGSGEGEHLTFVTPKSGFMSNYFESLTRNQFEGQV
jgi:hypothetical protein